MKFQPGRKKSAGRKAGTPNKFRLTSIEEFLQEAMLDPHVEIRKLLPLLTPYQQASILTRLAEIRARKQKGDESENPLPQGRGLDSINRNPALKEMSADQLIALIPVTNANGNAPRGN